MSSIEDYRAKRAEWLEMLDGEDQHSISKQIYGIMWDSAVSRALSQAIELAPRDSDGSPKVSFALADALHRWHASKQLLAIRKITEGYQGGEKRAVFSFDPLLKDMVGHAHLFTRENMLAVEGVNGDPQAAAKTAAHIAQQVVGGAAYIPDNADPILSRDRNAFIDRLTQSTEGTRSDSDVADSLVFENLQAKLVGASSRIKEHVDKLIAHAATPRSRTYVSDQSVLDGLTYREIWDAERNVCEAYLFLILLLKNASSGIVPEFDFGDQLEYLDQAWITNADLKEVRATWQGLEAETRTWIDWDWTTLLPQGGSSGSSVTASTGPST